MKAQALKHDETRSSDLSATELAENTEKLNEIIGYRVGKRGKITPLTTKELTGSEDECLFSYELSHKQMSEFFQAKRKIRKMEAIVEVLTTTSVVAATGFVVAFFFDLFQNLGELQYGNNNLILVLLGKASLSFLFGLPVFVDGHGYLDRFPKLSRKIVKNTATLKLSQGFTSVLTGKQFELRSLSVASLREAAVLTDTVVTLHRRVETLKSREGGTGLLEADLIRMQESLNEVKETTEQIRPLEERIAEILQREER